MKKQMWLALPALIIAASANAVPTIYPTDLVSLSSIVNFTDSAIVADDLDPKKVYALPPSTGEGAVHGLHTRSANLGFCREMGDFQTYSRDLSARINQLSIQELGNKKEVDRLEKELAAARIDAAKYVAEKKLQALFDLDVRIKDIEDRLTSLYQEANTCKTACDYIHDEMRNIEKEKTKSMKDRRILANQNVKDSRVYDKKKATVEAMQENVESARDSYLKIAARMGTIRANFLQLYSHFGKMEGGRTALKYTSKWSENITTIRAANPGIDVQQMFTQNAKLFASMKGPESLPGDLAILAYEMPGIQKDGVIELQSGFPGSTQVNLVLSLLGACPLIHPDYFDLPSGNNTGEMAYGLTFIYEYPTKMKLSVVAHYNLYKMYQKIITSSKKGGFFSSSTESKVEERNHFKDSFVVKWEEQDPANSIAEEERLNIESQMRRAIFERLASLALPIAPNRDSIIAAGAPPSHGAVVVADSLVKACPGNIYCMAGALVLQSLDAIFGSSSTTASYVQTQNFDQKETWEKSKVVYKPWITSYLSVKN